LTGQGQGRRRYRARVRIGHRPGMAAAALYAAAKRLLLYLQEIDPARSLPLYTEAIACTERSGDHFINSTLHNNAGSVALSAGDIPAARAHLEAGAQAGQQIGYQYTTLMANLGELLRAEGDPDGARSTFEAGLRISRRNGDKLEHRRRHPRPGLPGRRCGRLGPGSCAPRRRPGLS
jgi:tetratricopeptide (TPR) repeat protein